MTFIGVTVLIVSVIVIILASILTFLLKTIPPLNYAYSNNIFFLNITNAVPELYFFLNVS